MLPGSFELLLFTTDPILIRRAVSAGVDAIVIDWETRGKDRRQAGADTQINHDTPADLRRARASTTAPIVCRVNGVGDWTPDEIEAAIEGGATEILVPMVRSRDEVAFVLEHVDGRCGVGILVETCAAVHCAAEFTRLPLTRIYVGLNDLAIERRSRSLVEAVADGTVERVRTQASVPFGFGGLTVPDRGSPIPCRLLMGEMMRIGCAFSFLRRSFLRDIADVPLEAAVRQIRGGLEAARCRAPHTVERDRLDLSMRVESLCGVAAH